MWESALEREFMSLLRHLKEGRDELLQEARQAIEEYDLSPTEKARHLVTSVILFVLLNVSFMFL